MSVLNARCNVLHRACGSGGRCLTPWRYRGAKGVKVKRLSLGERNRLLQSTFLFGYFPRADVTSLDLRLERLPRHDVLSILRRSNNRETMLITVNTKTFLAEAATAASVLPCWHSFDEKRQSGYVLALAGRCAR